MAYIDNSQTKVELNDAIRGNSVSNLAPTAVNGSVQPVINVNPKDYRQINFSKTANMTATGSTTIFTADSTKRTLITGIIFSYSKDVACDVPTGSIGAIIYVQGGESRTLNLLAGLTLTAENQNTSIDFQRPLEIDKGSTVQIASKTFAAGALARSCSILGYTVD